MRLLITLLLLSGCSQNLAVLEAREADLERRLAALKARADDFGDLKAQSEALASLERELATNSAERPEAGEALAQLEAEQPAASQTPVFAPLPPESFFEGGTGWRFRMRISALEIQIIDLSKLLDEMEQLHARRKLVERKLEVLRGLTPAQK